MTNAEQYVYDLTLEGFHEDECGSATEGNGWYGLVMGPFTDLPADLDLTENERDELRNAAGAIVFQDTQGFNDVTFYGDETILMQEWGLVQAEQAELGDDDEDNG